MTFEASSAPIVRLAWERGLALPENSLLAGTDGTRLTHVADTGTLTVLRLWDQTVLTGPARALDACAGYSDRELADHSLLLRLTRDLGGRGGGNQTLFYADDLPLEQPGASLMVSHGNPEAVALESLCPPDDVNDVDLASLPHKFTVMAPEQADADDAGPLACGAYAEFAGMLAELRTLVAPSRRRQGWGLLATNIAAHEALAAGLILQWRAADGNAAAHALALRAGFSAAGQLLTVPLHAPHK